MFYAILNWLWRSHMKNDQLRNSLSAFPNHWIQLCLFTLVSSGFHGHFIFPLPSYTNMVVMRHTNSGIKTPSLNPSYVSYDILGSPLTSPSCTKWYLLPWGCCEGKNQTTYATFILTKIFLWPSFLLIFTCKTNNSTHQVPEQWNLRVRELSLNFALIISLLNFSPTPKCSCRVKVGSMVKKKNY